MHAYLNKVSFDRNGFHLGLIFLGSILLFVLNNNPNFWGDEAHTLIYISKTFKEIHELCFTGIIYPPYYFYAIKLFAAIFGNSILTIRAFSICGTVALSSLGYFKVRPQFGAKAGLIFSIVSMTLPSFFSYSYEARPYSWIFFFYALFVMLMIDSVAKKKSFCWPVIVITIPLILLQPYNLFLCVVSSALYIMWMQSSSGNVESLKFLIAFIAKSILPAVLFLVPWMIGFISHYSKSQLSYLALDGQIKDVTFFVKTIFSYFTTPLYFQKNWWNNNNFDLVSVTLYLPEILFGMMFIVGGMIKSRFTQNYKERRGLFLAYIGVYFIALFITYTITPFSSEKYLVPVFVLLVLSFSIEVARYPLIIRNILLGLVLVISIFIDLESITSHQKGQITKIVEQHRNELNHCVFIHTRELSLLVFYYLYPSSRHVYYLRNNVPLFIPLSVYGRNFEQVNDLERISFGHNVCYPIEGQVFMENLSPHKEIINYFRNYEQAVYRYSNQKMISSFDLIIMKKI